MAPEKSGDDFSRWAAQDLENALAHGPSQAELDDMLRRALLNGVDLGVSFAVSDLESTGFGFDWTLANDDAKQWAERAHQSIKGLTPRLWIGCARQSGRGWNWEAFSA